MRSFRSLSQAALKPKSASIGRPACRCFLHSSPAVAATPIPHPPVAHSPPDPPTPTVESPRERVERKRKQANLVQRAQTIRKEESKPSSPLLKRFWSTVSVQETEDGQGYHILLDKRPVKTAAKQTLLLPKERHKLAIALALEWDLLVSAQQALKNHYVPLTSLTSRALDIAAADKAGDQKLRNDLVKFLMGYLTTDTLLCWAPAKTTHDSTAGQLRDRQIAAAQDIISHLTAHLWPGIQIKPVLEEDSILPTPQPEETQEVIRSWISQLPPFELAAVERGVIAGKSLLVAVRLVTEWGVQWSDVQKVASTGKRFGAEEAAEACSLEVRWQTGMWGEVEDTHDVEKEDLKRQFGSCILLVT